MSYEVKSSGAKDASRPWDVWKDGRLVAGGFSTKGAAETHREALEGEEKLREVMRQRYPDRYT